MFFELQEEAGWFCCSGGNLQGVKNRYLASEVRNSHLTEKHQDLWRYGELLRASDSRVGGIGDKEE